MKTQLILSGLVGASLFLAHADSVRMKDGRSVDGSFLGGDENEIRVRRGDGQVERFRLGDVDSIYFQSGPGVGQVNDRYRYPANSSADQYPRPVVTEPQYPQATPPPQYREGTPVPPPAPAYDAGGRPFTRDSQPYPTDAASQPMPPATPPGAAAGALLPAGTVVTVRNIDPISSESAQTGQTYPASLDQPIMVNGQVLASVGNNATLQLVQVDRGGRIEGRPELSVVLVGFQGDDGHTYRIDSSADTVSGRSRGRQSAGVIGGGAALGAIVGAIVGGGPGAAVGAAGGAVLGAGAQVLRGDHVKIHSESRLSFSVTRDIILH